MTEKDIKIGGYYVVVNNVTQRLIDEHMMHGYADKWDFLKALRSILELWKGRVGECVEERYGFLCLRFHDTPGGKPDEAKIPIYLLEPTEAPPEEEREVEFTKELDEAFGFD
jgi:hypothetical protein